MIAPLTSTPSAKTEPKEMMNDSHQFEILSVNAPTVLPRVTLMFTRRGVPIDQLEMTTHDDTPSTTSLTDRSNRSAISSMPWRFSSSTR